MYTVDFISLNNASNWYPMRQSAQQRNGENCQRLPRNESFYVNLSDWRSSKVENFHKWFICFDYLPTSQGKQTEYWLLINNKVTGFWYAFFSSLKLRIKLTWEIARKVQHFPFKSKDERWFWTNIFLIGFQNAS